MGYVLFNKKLPSLWGHFPGYSTEISIVTPANIAYALFFSLYPLICYLFSFFIFAFSLSPPLECKLHDNNIFVYFGHKYSVIAGSL